MFALADDLVRVLFVRDGTLKEPRSWTVSPAGADVPWEGRDRLDVSAFPRPAFAVVDRGGEVALELPSAVASGPSRPLRLTLDEQRKGLRRGSSDATRTSGASAAASSATTWRGR